MPSFIVLALPRSRTKWLSHYLSYQDWHCGHDELQHMRSLEDVQTWFTQPNIGTCETAAAPWWRLLLHYQSDIRIVTVRRDLAEVLASVIRAVPDCDPVTAERVLQAADRKLDQIEARVPGVLSVGFDDLAHESVCARVFEHCLPYPHDPEWWACNVQQISGNLAAQIRYAQAYLPQLQKLARAAKHRSLALMVPNADPPELLAFQDEPFDAWYRDATVLFRDHMAQTGQDIEDWTRKNIPLGRRLDEAGAMQIITARSGNGMMHGYLMALISPTLDDPDALMANHLPVFASPECPGLGMKLQRASIEALRSKGVTEVFAKAGVRGSGPRLGAAYRRMGFEDAGQLYRLQLEAH